jgi:signal transduction histidine kinase
MPTIRDHKIPVIVGIAIIFIAIVDLLMTRQLLPYNTNFETLMFILTVTIGYGLGSWILLGYAKRVSKEVRTRSRFVNLMHWSVVVAQFSLLGILSFMLLFNINEGFLSRSIFAISSLLASIIMGAISFKFFSWYKVGNNKNFIVLFYGIAALTLALSIAEDAGTKLLMVNIVQEKSPVLNPSGSSFLYKPSEKYNAQIIYREVNGHTITLSIIPNFALGYYNYLNSIVLPVGFVFRWIASTMLLRNVYQRVAKLPLSFWIVLSLPLILYLVGKIPGFFSGESLSGVDEPYRFYFRILFRAGTISGNILFGLAFFMVARSLISSKLKDYLIIAAIGDTIAGISLSTSALQPTYGVAAHSLVLLSSYLFTLGLYSSAISVGQDIKIRQSIEKSAIEESKLLVSIGSAQMKQEIEKRVLGTAQIQKQKLEDQTGVQPSFTEQDMKQYLSVVLKQIKVLQNIDDIVKKGKSILENSAKFMLCSKSDGLRLAYNNYFDTYQISANKNNDREHKDLRIVTSITDKDGAELAKRFLDIGVTVRHVKNMPPIDFAVSDKEMIATIQKTEAGQAIQNLLTTNEPAYIEHFNSIFDELWKDGIDADYRIKDIEQGTDTEGITVIQNPHEVQKLAYELVKSTKEEALAIFSTANAFHRQEYAGTLGLMKKLVEERDIKVRILTPVDDPVELDAQALRAVASINKINIRFIEPELKTKVSILVVDRKYSLVVELKDDTKLTTEEAIGLATYSNSKSTVLSYCSIFESMWKQTDLYQKLNQLYEQLKVHDRMQKEFIDVAAHELRTPIQPILSLSEIIRTRVDSEEQQLLDVIIRNSKRLQRLTDDILDVSKIESQSLILNKERFDLNRMVLDIIQDFEDQLRKEKKDCTLKFSQENRTGEEGDDTIFLEADKGRITQVISNLLNNALKFTKQGTITIAVRTEKQEGGTVGDDYVLASVKDDGTGIDPAIMPRLFSKFVTNSQTGTGLGLFISKSIIEAHGGKIWAENNESNTSKGAIFYFTLPIRSHSLKVIDMM